MPTQYKRGSDSRLLTISSQNPLRASRDALFYPVVGQPGLVAKIYRQDANELIPKLLAMIDSPPNGASPSQGHASIDWPTDLLYTADLRDCVGVLLPKLPSAVALSVVFNPATRRRERPAFTYRHLYRTASNLAGAVSTLHQQQCVVGELDGQIALVTDAALVTLTETDSYQIFDPKTRKVFRCLYGRPEYTAPELQTAAFADTDREPSSDNFSLAVLIFQLLMEGAYPFVDSSPGEQSSGGYKERILSGRSIFDAGQAALRAGPGILPATVLPRDLTQLFERCLVDGRHDPSKRPFAKEWAATLHEAEARLVICAVNKQHLYPNYLERCPWCEMMREDSIADPFPTREEIEFGPIAGNRAAQAPLVSTTGAAPSTSVAASSIPAIRKPSGAVDSATSKAMPAVPSIERVVPNSGRSKSFPVSWLGAVIVLAALAAGWAALRPHHAATHGIPTVLPSSPGSVPPSGRLASQNVIEADAAQHAQVAQNLLDGVTRTILASEKRPLTATQASELRNSMALQCRSAEQECDLSIQEDQNCQPAWLQRIRGYRLLAKQSEAAQASQQAAALFAGDPEMLSKLAASGRGSS